MRGVVWIWLATLLLPLSVLAQTGRMNVPTRIDVHYEMKSVGGINTVYSDFSPQVIGDNETLLFTSDREFDLVNTGENRWEKRKHLNVFEADILSYSLDTVKLDVKGIYSEFLMTNSHVGPVCVNTSGAYGLATMVTIKAGSGKTIYHPQLYTFKLQDGKVQKPEVLYADNEHSYGHPTISPDGKFMIFASDVDGGAGNKDLYLCTRENDAWSSPINLKSLNTNGDEVFPFLLDSVIYFSSDGRNGRGGLDLYRAEFQNGEVGEVIHLGDTMNSAQDDFGICFFQGSKAGLFSSNREGGVGEDDIYFFELVETVVVESREIAGRFRYRSLNSNASDMDVMLIDDDGNMLFKTQTDEDGNFKFRNLEYDEDYTIKALNNSDDLELVIFSKDGEEVGYLLSNASGEFIYKRLQRQEVGTLALIDEDDIDLELNEGKLSGQFVYEHLNSDYPDGLEVLLVDDDGNVVFKTTTDEYGNFEFRNLKMDENYNLRANSEEDITLLVYNSKNQVTAILRMNENGEFVYRRLKSEREGDLALMELDDESMFDELTVTVFGQFHYRDLDKPLEDPMKFQVVDDEENLIMNGKSDDNGFFRLKNLPVTGSYMFKIATDDPRMDADITLTVMNRSGKKVALLDKNQDGFFVYSPLGLGGDMTIDQQNEDDIEITFTKDIPKIYFGYNSTAISGESAEVLSVIITTLKNDSNLKLEVSSYADAKGSEEYNLKLSQRRTDAIIKYLTRKGISRSRLTGNAYGESNLVNECDDESDCPDELMRLNRRAEFRIF